MMDQLYGLTADKLRMFGLNPSDLFERDSVTGLGNPGRISANGTCRLIEAKDGWLALNLARQEDIEVLPALTGLECDSWEAVIRAAGVEDAEVFRDRAIELQLPVAIVGESETASLAKTKLDYVPAKVVDLSALWAGPLCAGLLARAGAEVCRVISTGRPDPTATNSPRLDSLLNCNKIPVELDLRGEPGRARLFDMIGQADVLVTSARPEALSRLGLDPVRFPHLTWVGITAHGFSGPEAGRVGFGDDCAAAGGLIRWQHDEPQFFGDALADPLTGLEAAAAVISGKRGLLDMAMSRVAATYARAVA